MDIRDITQENICEYEELANSNEAENIGRSCYKGLMAYDDDTAVGCIVWFIIESGEDEYTEEIVFFSASNKDVYSSLLKEHDDRIVENNITSSYIEIPDMPKELREELEEAGFSLKEGEGRDVVVTLGDLKKMKLPKLSVPQYIRGLERLDELDFWNGVTYTLYHGRKGLLEDMDTLPLSWYNPKISCCILTDGWIEGMLLIHMNSENALMPVLFFCNGRNNQKNLIYMMKYAIYTASHSYPDDTKIVLRRHDDSTRKLISYLLPKKKGVPVVIGRR